MSGLVKDNIFGSSGSVIEAAGGLSWQPVVTASTVTVGAAKGYFINTTSNACTITLPSSAEAGDQIILVDYARTWGTNAITIDSNGLNFQSSDDTYIVDYDTAGQALNLVYSGATVGWTPSSDIVNALEPVAPTIQKAIFGYGKTSSDVSLTNLVNSSGVVATDVTGVGTARNNLAASSYGGDKAIFGYGRTSTQVSMTNLVNNSGVVATDVSGVGTARQSLAAASYGGDKAIFGYGTDSSLTNLVTNQGVVGNDVSGVGTARNDLAAASYGGDKAIFGYGYYYSGGVVNYSLTNKVSNSGVVASDTTGVGTARYLLAAAGYGGDKAIFGFGTTGSVTGLTNLVSNTGVVASNVSAVGTARKGLAAAGYGGDKAIFGYGTTGSLTAITNLVNNSGVVASDVSGVGTAREKPAAAGFSYAA
mgnify:CR=1 FL=1|jgi:hypothetical protein